MDQGLSTLLSQGIYLFGKISILLLLSIHLLFSLLLIRQTKTMLRVVEAKISPIIYGISIVHALYSIFVLIWAALFL